MTASELIPNKKYKLTSTGSVVIYVGFDTTLAKHVFAEKDSGRVKIPENKISTSITEV